MLGEALLRLRQKRDARGALAALDEYRARYPNGTLKREAETARIDALLLLGRNDEALAELGALTLQPVGRDQELRLIRGELAAATDCKRAVVDSNRILNEQATAAVVERALHGRAACLPSYGGRDRRHPQSDRLPASLPRGALRPGGAAHPRSAARRVVRT